MVRQEATTDDERSIWIAGIPATTRAVELKELFAPCGRVKASKIFTTRSGDKTFGRITMFDMPSVNFAMSQLQDTTFQGQCITLGKGDSPPRANPASASAVLKQNPNSGQSPDAAA